MPAPPEGAQPVVFSRASPSFAEKRNFTCGAVMPSRPCGASLRPASRQSQCAAGQRLQSADPLDQIMMAPFSDLGRIIMRDCAPREAIEFSVAAARQHIEPEFPCDERHDWPWERNSLAVVWGSAQTQQFESAPILPLHHLSFQRVAWCPQHAAGIDRGRFESWRRRRRHQQALRC